MTASLKPIIAPSLLASDLCCASEGAQRMIEAGCDWLHIDIMDGHFVPNLTVGPAWVKSLRLHAPLTFFDVHLMVDAPLKWVGPFADAGASLISFHWEAVGSAEAAREVAQAIRSRGVKVGLALKPGTQLQDIGTTLERPLLFDMVLVMTVEPGFGGQKFMPQMCEKVKQVRSLFPELDIEVDGGLDQRTVKEAASAGANVIVAGTSMFSSDNPRALMEYMRAVVKSSLDA